MVNELGLPFLRHELDARVCRVVVENRTQIFEGQEGQGLYSSSYGQNFVDLLNAV